MSGNTLKADYASLSSNKEFAKHLPSLSKVASQQSIQDKTAYLSALRANVAQMQGEINTYLTQKMDDDKAADSKKSRDEAKAEEMYGEEDPETDG